MLSFISDPKNLTRIVEGIYQIRLPIPIRSLGSVFSYLVQDGRNNLLIDAGWPSEESFKALEASLAEIGLSPAKIETVVVSHLHPDHFGLTEQIRDQNPNLNVIMHEHDAANVMSDYKEYDAFIGELHSWLELHGTPAGELNAMLIASTEMLRFFRPPKPSKLVMGGEMIKVGDKWNFEIVHTPGHTRGTICLHDLSGSRVFFSGDHILPKITPNVSRGPFYMEDPLGDYLSSLEKVSNLDVGLVLPSHEHAFSDLLRRCDEIREHHNERLQDVISALQRANKNSRRFPKDEAIISAYSVASALHWFSGSWEALGPWERRAAIMETLAHLEYLKRTGKIKEVAFDSLKPRIGFTLV